MKDLVVGRITQLSQAAPSFGPSVLNDVLEDTLKVRWRTGLPDREGRYVVLYKHGKQEEKLFIADIYHPCTAWSIGLDDVTITAWLDGLTFSLLSSNAALEGRGGKK